MHPKGERRNPSLTDASILFCDGNQRKNDNLKGAIPPLRFRAPLHFVSLRASAEPALSEVEGVGMTTRNTISPKVSAYEFEG